MKRRDFSLLATAAGATAGVIWPTFAQADVARPEAGTDYVLVDPQAPVEAPAGKIEVVEFFWYNCPHCSAFEPAVEAWVKRLPKDVAFKRVPVAFDDSFNPQQRLFYALEAMNKVDELHNKVFQAIHVQKIDLKTQDKIAAWVEKQGVDKAKFLELYNSFSVSTKARKATQLQNAYAVDGVPALGIAGRFYTNGSFAGNMDKALNVVDYLVAEVRKGR